MGKTLSARRKTNLQITIGKKEAHKSHISKKQDKTMCEFRRCTCFVRFQFTLISSKVPPPLCSTAQSPKRGQFYLLLMGWGFKQSWAIVVLYCPYSHFYLNVFSHSHAWNAQKVVSYYQNLFGMLCNILFWKFLQCIL